MIKQHNFIQIFEHKDHTIITNEGWATILLEKWNAEFNKKREEKLKRISKFIFNFYMLLKKWKA